MKRMFYSFILSTFFFISQSFAQPIKLEMWHALEGFFAEKLDELVDRFNASQKDYEIYLTRKGNYSETYKEGLKAAKAQKNAPHILQVYEVATPTFLLEKSAYIPVYDLLKKYGYTVSDGLIPAIIDFYSDEKGQLLGLPFNISSGVLYYNKDAFQKAELSGPPQTWEEVESYALKLRNAGSSCALTTAWPSGYLLEHFGARHNVPFATQENGFKGKGTRLLVNSQPFVFNVSKFSEWQKDGTFKYGGRDVSEAEKLFTSGECAMILQSTNRLVVLQKPAKFKVGVGPLPYWTSLTKKPHNLVTGGAALWAIKGHKKEEEKGVAEFFNFVAQPENQQFWAEATGYLPISKAAYQLLKKSGYYDKNPQAHIGIESLMLPSTPYSKGIRIAGFVDVREVLIDALEGTFEGKKPAKEALSQAIEKGNILIQKAEREVL